MNTPAFFTAAVRTVTFLVLVTFTGFWSLPAGHAATASPPERMAYQGFLTDTDGVPLGAETPMAYTVVFRMFPVPTGGSEIWSEQQTVTVDKGYFSILLGEGTEVTAGKHGPLSTIFSSNNASDRHVEMTVIGLGSPPSNVTILPRLQLMTSPYSFLANSTLKVVDDVGADLLTANPSGGVNITGSITSSETVNAASITTSGGITSTGAVNATSFSGDGSALSNLDGARIQGSSVTSTQIMDGTILSGDIANGTITSGNILDNTIEGVDIKNNTIADGKLASSIDTTALPNTIVKRTPQGDVTARRLLATYDVSVESVNPMFSFNTVGGLANRLGVNYANGLSTGAGTQDVVLSARSGKLHLNYGGGSPALTVDTSNNVGIGTQSPTQAKLVVSGSVSGSAAGDNGYAGAQNTRLVTYIDAAGLSFRISEYWSQLRQASINGVLAGAEDWRSKQPTSIYAAQAIWTGSNLIVSSDERIKNVKGPSDPSEDLETLLGIVITDYHYKDVIDKGGSLHKKVIAQQVEKVYPQAVSKRTDVVPDIFKPATCKDGWVHLKTDLKKGDRVKLISADAENVHEVLEVRENEFLMDFRPDDGRVFVYGREVSDFRAVDYEAIAMLNVSATQELTRRLVKVEQRENTLAALEHKAARVTSLENEVAQLKKLVLQLASARESVNPSTPTAGSQVASTAAPTH